MRSDILQNVIDLLEI